MTLYICPTDHVGPLVVPEGTTDAWVWNCPGLTSVTFPKGTTVARVRDCPGLTSVTFPEGCTEARVRNCPNATITRQRLEDAPVKGPGPVCKEGC